MNTFSVKNFEKFQHYKDRNPPWIKLYNELLDDYEFGLLPDASKMHLIAIWLLASRSENKIPLDPTWVERRINATEKVDLTLLAERGFILLDQPLQGVEQVDSKPLAECLSRERERDRAETETETEQRQKTRASALAPAWTNDDRVSFWERFPNKVGKADAMKAFDRATHKTSPEVLFPALDRYAHKTDDRPFCNPATWLNQERWLDQPAANPNGRRTVQQAADDLLTKLRAFDEPAPDGLRDGEGQNAVRLLSSR